ncbi:MAG TPA: MFS transporter [Usitatibacter sp.]|nr:MFS transporter [Usitatibacter sp.]
MTAAEVKSSLALASIFGLRLFGMFVILPVFALWATGRPGWTLELAGIAMGAYGLTQGLLQIPYGWLSDRVGRKPMLYVGLAIFATGSFICAVGDDPWVMIAGRIVQGMGAVSGVAIAAVADLTRDSQRTKAMAIVGSTIGVVFAVSFVVAPFLERRIGVTGIFALTGTLVLCAIGVVRWLVPDAPRSPRASSASAFSRVFRDAELLRLYAGIFALHAVLMALFVVVPVALVQAGLPAAEHSWVYLGAVAVGFVLMVPFVTGRASGIERPVFLVSIGLILVALALLVAELASLGCIVLALVIFFTGFNVLEAKLPSLVSRAAPRESTGAATGVYSSVQFLGTFFGAAAGGSIAQHGGFIPVLVTCLAVTAAWLAVAWNMDEFLPAASPASRT